MSKCFAIHCTVIGPDRAVRRFREVVFQEDQGTVCRIFFDFNKFIPTPVIGGTPAQGMLESTSMNLPQGRLGLIQSEFEKASKTAFVMEAEGWYLEPILDKLSELFPKLSFDCVPFTASTPHQVV